MGSAMPFSSAERRFVRSRPSIPSTEVELATISPAPATAPTRAAVPAWLAQEVRTLLTLAHPDKWSAGQAAAPLAHELTVRLNGLRQRLGEAP